MPRSPEPLSLEIREAALPPGFASGRCRRIEYSSRGDRVPGRLLLPERGDGPFPLLLFQHGARGSLRAEYMQSAAPWVKAGLAVLSIDFPLHGERHSAKLSERLLAPLHGAENAGASAFDGPARTLWTAFARQSICDLRRGLDAVTTLAEIDGERTAYAAFSLGSLVGALFCALDPRPRAAALALAGGGFGPEAIDPIHYIGRLAPRPLLMLCAQQDELIPKQASERLYAAAGEPKRLEWFDSAHSGLPGRAMKSLWLFIREQLELA